MPASEAASLMAEAGADQAYTMRQIGHRSAALTLEVYTDVNDRRHPATAKLGSLLVAPDWALTGTENAVVSLNGDRKSLADALGR